MSYYRHNDLFVYNEIHMPSKSPEIGTALKTTLRELGQRLRAQRKRLGVSAIATAESAGMSRVTLHRIERGEPSVAMGAYLSVVFSLGLALDVVEASRLRKKTSMAKPPAKIKIADYQQLKRLAWQLKDTKELTPREALDLYERNWRHVDTAAMDEGERELIEVLLAAFGRERLLV